MTLEQLEHLIRASAAISGEYDLVIVGSAAILASFPNAPDILTQTREADLYPRMDPSKADIIDAVMGEGSSFDIAFGYYAHGVGPETAAALAGPLRPCRRSVAISAWPAGSDVRDDGRL